MGISINEDDWGRKQWISLNSHEYSWLDWLTWQVAFIQTMDIINVMPEHGHVIIWVIHYSSFVLLFTLKIGISINEEVDYQWMVMKMVSLISNDECDDY